MNVPVKVIDVVKESALVEWSDEGYPRRVVVPARLVAPEMDSDDLAAGIQAGDRFEEILPAPAPWNLDDLATELRRRGVWDAEDLLTPAGQRAALGALQYLYQIELATLVQAAAGYVEKGK